MQEFFSDHPLVWQLAIFPLVTALFTWLLKPRTPEDYASSSCSAQIRGRRRV